jgi:aminopeptidase N
VTMRWWDNLWLNEGFADWMEKKPMQSLHPSFHGELESVKDMGDALRLDSLRNTHPIHVKAETPDEINELFDPISYQKGAAVMRMIEAYLTPEVFRRGINMYLRKFQYGNATAEDFWTTMTQASGRPVDKIMPTFINQPGEPLVTVKAECLATPQATPKKTSRKRRTRRVQPHPKTEITLAQERFSGDGDPGGSSQPWLIPVCIKTNENKPFCQLLGERRQVVPVVGCSSWVFTNTNAVGYYRTQYDANGLGKLAGVATSSLNTAERMALIDDEWALVVSGQEKIGNFLDLVGALNSVPERAVEERYKNSLEYVGHAVTGSGESEPYRSWLQANFRPQLAKIGWTPKADESDDAKQLRADFLELLGIFAKDSETIRQSTTLARQYLKDPRSVDSTLAPAVLGVAAYSGDGSLLNEFISALNHASTPEEYYDIERALSKFRGADAAARILEMSVSAEVRNQDAPQLIGAVLSNAANRDFAWQWIKSHWSEVERKFTGNNGVDVVNGAAGFCDAEHRDDVQKFFTDHKVASSERTLKQISELIDTCTSFRNRQQNNLSVWLGQHAGGATQGQN